MLIAQQTWTFRIVHGRQFVDGEEYLTLIDPAADGGGEIRITDTVPLGEQLELAALAAMTIFSKSVGLVPLLAEAAGEVGGFF
jgi:hypothetical protein